MPMRSSAEIDKRNADKVRTVFREVGQIGYFSGWSRLACLLTFISHSLIHSLTHSTASSCTACISIL